MVALDPLPLQQAQACSQPTNPGIGDWEGLMALLARVRQPHNVPLNHLGNVPEVVDMPPRHQSRHTASASALGPAISSVSSKLAATMGVGHVDQLLKHVVPVAHLSGLYTNPAAGSSKLGLDQGVKFSLRVTPNSLGQRL